MNLVIANVAPTLTDAIFAATVTAIAVQVSRDFTPEWGAEAALRPVRLALCDAHARIDCPVDAVIYVGSLAQDPTTGVDGAFGYHSTNHGHIPYGFVYLDVCQRYGEAWSCTLSHEVLELLADPHAQLTVSGPRPLGSAGARPSVHYDLEVCDPTQSDAYEINKIKVSNFVTRRYFGLAGRSADTNFTKLPLYPFGVRPGGYLQYEDEGGVHQINGSEVTPERIAARQLLKSYRRNARRAAKFAAARVAA